MHHHYLLNKLHSYPSQFINQHATPCPVIAKAADTGMGSFLRSINSNHENNILGIH